MADLPTSPVTVPGRPVATSTVSVKASAAAALTTYTEYPTSPDGLLCLGWNSARLAIDYKPGSETSLEWLVEGYDGATWRTLLYKDAQSGGVSVVTPDPIQAVAATFTTFLGAGVTGYFLTPPIDIRGIQKLRAKEKYTGSAPSAGRSALGFALGMDIVA